VVKNVASPVKPKSGLSKGLGLKGSPKNPFYDASAGNSLAQKAESLGIKVWTLKSKLHTPRSKARADHQNCPIFLIAWHQLVRLLFKITRCRPCCKMRNYMVPENETQTPLGRIGIISELARNISLSKTLPRNTVRFLLKSIKPQVKLHRSIQCCTRHSSSRHLPPKPMSPLKIYERGHGHYMSINNLGRASLFLPQSSRRLYLSRVYSGHLAHPICSLITRLRAIRSSLPPISLLPLRQITRPHSQITVNPLWAQTKIERLCKCRNGFRYSRVTQ
jgi:hypothetical protein